MKKMGIVLSMVICINFLVVAQTPKNTVSIDIAPALFGMVYTVAERPDTLALAGGIQYERMIDSKYSFGGRFAYAYYDTSRFGSLSFGGNADKTMNTNSFSIELHGRYYPFQNRFFLDGMVGYAFAKTTFGNVFLADDKFEDMASFFKAGIKVGWKIYFGNSRFVFEPSLGYSIGFGSADKDVLDFGWYWFNDGWEHIGDYDRFRQYDFLFIGGPKISLNFGYSF